MIDYEKASEAVYLLRKSPVLVIYHGEKPKVERMSLDKLKGFCFISDMHDFIESILGLEFSGLVIEENVEISDYFLKYALTRMRIEPKDMIIAMSRAHKEQIMRVVESFDNYDEHTTNYIKEMRKLLGVYQPVNLTVKDE